MRKSMKNSCYKSYTIKKNHIAYTKIMFNETKSVLV